ncbi:sarcosine oxidase subunit gamma [Tropicimonas isoalkanivorans]|uniref:Sarcosine oxidase subunit gamma n=1 Tax=Tropicimonas isoalkanivorans TaxID=441112 RepID=A0A1I1G228_9RHOB|nr:sarcosine oxidase subunit gamma family protein [Tropicimonas isoalkanivorans]SFC05376.1 sarcosine oxidase subunit gamma [Tropicimonas isoalkanivorans]
MSEARSPLGGAVCQGEGAKVEELPAQGMVTLRGAMGDIADAVTAAIGLSMPSQREIVIAGDKAVAWMSPDELLLLMPHAEVQACLTTLSERLDGTHHLAVDVSDARAVFRISGAGAREVLARLCPADLSPAAFGPGELRRTRLAQVPAAFWIDEAGAFRLICFRSVARYAFDVLCGAARGAPVGFFPESDAV